MLNKAGNHKSKIIIVMLLIAALVTGSFALSFAESQEEIDAANKAAQDAKAATEAKRKEAKDAAKKAAAAIDNFEAAEEELNSLQDQMDATQAQINYLTAQIAEKEAEIEATVKKIQKKEAEIQAQNDALGDRLTAMYKTGSAGFVDVVLNSESVEDLLANLGMVQKILESDQKLLEKLKEDYKELQAIKAELQEQELALQAQQIDLEQQEINLEAQQAETEELVAKYKAEADRLKALEDQLEAEAEQLAAEAAAKQAEAERMILEEGGTVDVPVGAWAWPTQSNWIMTSNYGWRRCPFHGREFHNGLDLCLKSGTYGSPVYAIQDGIVTRASWYGGYGNCIQIAHGNGYSSLYGHLKGYNCKNGQFVKKGEVIGYIGSTGNSTGPHLHFTVFLNGSIVNPYSLY